MLFKSLKNISISNLLLTLFSSVTVLLAIEVYCISTDVLVPQEYLDRHRMFYDFLEPDDKLGFKPKPLLNNFHISWENGGGVDGIYSTDQYGFRNAGRDYNNSNIFFVGDSFAFGAWMKREETFYGLIESKLEYPVITLSAGGYRFRHYEVIFHEYVVKYKPDMAVLCIYANDLSSEPPLENWYEYYKWTKYKKYPFYKKMFTYNLYTNLHKALSGMTGSSENDFDNNKKTADNGLLLYRNANIAEGYFPHGCHKIHEEILTGIIDVANRNEINLLIVLIPSKESAYVNHFAKLFPKNMQHVKDEEIAFNRLCNISEVNDVPCINLTAAFRKKNEEKVKLYFDRDPHWNHFGHELAAKQILPYIRNYIEESPFSFHVSTRN